MRGPIREQKSEGSADHRQRYALNKKLEHNARAARPQRSHTAISLSLAVARASIRPVRFAQAISRIIPTANTRTHDVSESVALARQAPLRGHKRDFGLPSASAEAPLPVATSLAPDQPRGESGCGLKFCVGTLLTKKSRLP